MEIRKDNQGHIREYFNSSVGYWDEIYTGEKFINLHMEDRKQKVFQLLEKYRNGKILRILDLGCGSGLLTKPLLKQGHCVIGMDCSLDMLQKFVGSLDPERTTGPCRVILGDGEKSCFKAGVFDVVICIGVVQYQVDEETIIDEVRRILRQGGVGIISAPNLLRLNYLVDPTSYIRFFRRIAGSLVRHRMRYVKPHWTKSVSGMNSKKGPVNRKFVHWQLTGALERKGLRIKEIVGFGFGPLTLFGKQMMTDARAWKWSERMGCLSQKVQLMKLLANRWLFVIEKL